MITTRGPSPPPPAEYDHDHRFNGFLLPLPLSDKIKRLVYFQSCDMKQRYDKATDEILRNNLLFWFSGQAK